MRFTKTIAHLARASLTSNFPTRHLLYMSHVRVGPFFSSFFEPSPERKFKMIKLINWFYTGPRRNQGMMGMIIVVSRIPRQLFVVQNLQLQWLGCSRWFKWPSLDVAPFQARCMISSTTLGGGNQQVMFWTSTIEYTVAAANVVHMVDVL